MFTDGRMDGWITNVVCTHKGILFGLKNSQKGILTQATTRMNLEDIILKLNKPAQKDKCCMTHVDEVPREVEIIDTERRMVVPRGCGVERGRAV